MNRYVLLLQKGIMSCHVNVPIFPMFPVSYTEISKYNNTSDCFGGFFFTHTANTQPLESINAHCDGLGVAYIGP